MVSKPLAHRQPSFGLAKPNHHLFQHCQPSIGTFTTSHHLNIANSHFSNIRVVRDFTIHSNTNGLGLRSNAIKDLCPLILHQLVIGWIGKAHGPTSGIRAKVIGSSHWSHIVREGLWGISQFAPIPMGLVWASCVTWSAFGSFSPSPLSIHLIVTKFFSTSSRAFTTNNSTINHANKKNFNLFNLPP